MKLSIIIPYHDYPQYLIDCLTSVKEQNLSDFETILITTHENEALLEIIERFKASVNLKHIVSSEQASVAVNRNIGLKHAVGEYVYFLDSDDYLTTNALSKLLAKTSHFSHDLVSGTRRTSWYKKATYEGIQAKPIEDTLAQITLADEVIEEEELKTLSQEVAVKYLLKRRKSLSGFSVLHALIKRELLETHQITFDEKYIYYADLTFIIRVINQTETYSYEKSAIYIKRKHNDSINMPSLSQTQDGTRFNEYIEAYRDCCQIVGVDSPIRLVLNQKMLNYYCNYFAKKIRRSEASSWTTERFEIMVPLIQDLHPQLLARLIGYRKKLVNATLASDIEKVKKVITRNLLGKRIKTLIKTKNKREIYKALYRHRYLKQEVEPNWIIFESFFGKSYSDSPKYIYEYLAKNFPGKYKFIWVLNDKKTPLPYDGIKVERFSRAYAYYLAKSKYLVFNGRQPVWLKKRADQVFLQTWHGTPLKRLVFDQEDVTAASPTYKMQVYGQKKAWDYLIAANQFSSDTFKRCFMYDGAMLETGYPRNDLLHAPDKAIVADEIKHRLGIPTDKKTVLYAPTWRDDEYIGVGAYKFKLQLDLDLLQKELGDEYVVLLRTHYFIAESLDLKDTGDFVFNLSAYDDITELYLISDVLITDYSSVFFDYASLKRPILFFTYDLDKYRDMLRGFYIDMEQDLPGPLVFTSEEIVDRLKNIEVLQEQYKEKYETFYETYCAWEDGFASKRVVEEVFLT